MRRLGEDLTSRYFVVDRETLYQSPVALTPYLERGAHRRAGDRRASSTTAYAGAGLHPDNIDTGSVILTGEALRRENAQAIAELLAEIGGEFVCAAAGHHMEAMLAAYGSGAAKASHDRGARILNIDIGGGTTKLALRRARQASLHTAAIHIGGRLIVVDERAASRGSIPPGAQLAALAGCDWKLGDAVTDAGSRPRRGDGWPMRWLRRITQAAPRTSRAVADRAAAGRSEASRRHVLRRRGRVRLRPRGARLRRPRPPARPRDARAPRRRTAAAGRCCPRASASAPPRSAPRNTACSCRATPSTSRSPASCCRARTCRCCSRRVASRRGGRPAEASPRRSASIFSDFDLDRGRGRSGARVPLARRSLRTSASAAFARGILTALPRTIAPAKPAVS